MTARDTVRPPAERLSNCAKHVNQVGTNLPRSRTLLRNIEQTLDALRISQRAVEMASSTIADEIERIRASSDRKKLDKDGSIAKSLLETQQSLKAYHQDLKERRDSAKADISLRQDDGIVEEYCHFINAVAELHNDINTFRWTIAEHDADNAKRLGRFDSSEKLFAFLDGKVPQA